MPDYPSYLQGFHNSTLSKKIEAAYKLLKSCQIYPRKCQIDRLYNEKGFCRVGLEPLVCSYMPHYGEEPPISGKKGSGTIFFSYCNLRCCYCQNYQFSQEGEGEKASVEKLSQFMLDLQKLGCHNINLVTPTHVMPQILKALNIAIENGLNIPLVYNTSGYELPEIIRLLDGIIDIYLTDMRYGDDENALKYSQAPQYTYYNQEAVREMYRQVGECEFEGNGIIKKGLIIRHLVLPQDICGTQKIMQFISGNLSKKVYISLMSQYQPYYQAYKYPGLSRRISQQEYQQAIDCLNKYGLENGWTQDSYGLERFAGIHIKKGIE
jgi:putative pyruvate formate lyase activating enzyme